MSIRRSEICRRLICAHLVNEPADQKYHQAINCHPAPRHLSASSVLLSGIRVDCHDGLCPEFEPRSAYAHICGESHKGGLTVNRGSHCNSSVMLKAQSSDADAEPPEQKVDWPQGASPGAEACRLGGPRGCSVSKRRRPAKCETPADAEEEAGSMIVPP